MSRICAALPALLFCSWTVFIMFVVKDRHGFYIQSILQVSGAHKGHKQTLFAKQLSKYYQRKLKTQYNIDNILQWRQKDIYVGDLERNQFQRLNKVPFIRFFPRASIFRYARENINKRREKCIRINLTQSLANQVDWGSYFEILLIFV